MIIKSIELNNFRIYKGVNRIDFTPDGERNIVIISGNNGFGKTTFLMSLVWCLYGRQMENVEDLYKKEIVEKGGYGRYIGNSLNKEAQRNGETRFSVSVTFTDVEIPDTTCTEITIIRSIWHQFHIERSTRFIYTTKSVIYTLLISNFCTFYLLQSRTAEQSTKIYIVKYMRIVSNITTQYTWVTYSINIGIINTIQNIDSTSS